MNLDDSRSTVGLLSIDCDEALVQLLSKGWVNGISSTQASLGGQTSGPASTLLIQADQREGPELEQLVDRP